jgi:protein-tyrosine phosphatase
LLDFHNHVIPCVDDGASSDEEAVAALRAFHAQGVTAVIATPHLSGMLTLRPDALAERLAEIDRGWERLIVIAATGCPDVELHRGAEIMLDTPSPEIADERVRLAGGSFVLVEFPYMTVPPRSSAPLQRLHDGGYVPVLAHPERYVGLDPGSALPQEWRDAGALLQINAGSITGRYGPQVRTNALRLLERGLVDYMCSDYHSRSRPSTAHAIQILSELGGEEQASLLTAVNPSRLLQGERPIPVPAMPRLTGLMERLRQWLR